MADSMHLYPSWNLSDMVTRKSLTELEFDGDCYFVGCASYYLLPSSISITPLGRSYSFYFIPQNYKTS